MLFMQAITLIEPHKIPNPVVTVGTFDGVHIGHIAVIEALMHQAKCCNGTSVVVTFDPHPRQIIDGENAIGLLTTLKEKKDRLAKLGIDLLAVVPFDQTLRHMSPEGFVQTHLVQNLGAKAVMLGYDHGFGKDRQGGFETMRVLGQKYNFSVESIPPTIEDGQPVSSTRIRQAIERGDFESVCRFLGSGYPMWGKVIQGDGRGRALGFPTANLSFESSAKQLPPLGVYVGQVFLPQRHLAVINYGQRPTFQGITPTFEVHILDFNHMVYGQELKLELCHRIRNEQAFQSRDALLHQIEQDIKTAKSFFSHSETTLIRR